MSLQRCCPAHTTEAVTKHLHDKWIQDARGSAINGQVDLIAVITAAEMIKRSMVTIGERGYAAQSAEAVDVFQRDVEAALEKIVAIPVEGAS